MRPPWAVLATVLLFSLTGFPGGVGAFQLPHVRAALGRAGELRISASAVVGGRNSNNQESLPRQQFGRKHRRCVVFIIATRGLGWTETGGRYRWAVSGSGGDGGQDNDAAPDENGKDFSGDDASEGVSETSVKQVSKVQGAAERLRAYGLAGVLAYGVMNQLYYSTAFAVLWLGPMGAVAMAAPAGAGLGAKLAVSSKQFGKVMVLVWAGSQATKPLRYLLAPFFAPAAEMALTSTQKRLRLPSRQRTFFLLCAALLSTTASFCAAAVGYAAIRAAAATTTTSAAAQASSFLVGGLGSGSLGGWWRSSISPGTDGAHCGGGRADGGREGLSQSTPGWTKRGDVARVITRRIVGPDAADGGKEVMLDRVQPRDGGEVRAGTGSEFRVSSPPKDNAGDVRNICTPSTTETAIEPGAGSVMKQKRKKRVTPQKAADLNPPPQENMHGWQEHPKHLLGFWHVHPAEALPAPQADAAPGAVAAAAPSVAAAAVLAVAAAAVPAETCKTDEERLRGRRPSGGDGNGEFSTARTELFEEEAYAIEAEGGFGDRVTGEAQAVDLGADILHHVNYVVLKRDGSLKAGPARLGIVPRSWRFAPANRRLLFEVDVPGRGIALRYSAKLTRVPGRFTMAGGLVRVRSMSEAVGDMDLPTASRSWPKLAAFNMSMQLKDKVRHNDDRKNEKP